MPSPAEPEAAAFELGVQEPWPADATLYQPYEVEQILLPDHANCLAVQAFLKMCRLPFTVEMRWNAEWMSPVGRVPFLRCGAFLVAELEGVAGLCAERGAQPHPNLTQDQRTDMRAYMSMLNNVLLHAELYVCWVEPKTYEAVTKIRHGSVFPWPLKILQTASKRSQVRKKLKVFGWLDRSLDDVMQEVDNCCRALSNRLDGRDFFFGDIPCELDALVFGHVFAIVTTVLPCSRLAETVQRFPDLIALAWRIDNLFKKKP